MPSNLDKALADGALPEARSRIDRFTFGPPVGFPVQFRVIGPDPMVVRDIAYKVRDVVKENKNIRDPQLDWNEQSPYLKLVVDQDVMRRGIETFDVAKLLLLVDIDQDVVVERAPEAGPFHLARLEHGVAVRKDHRGATLLHMFNRREGAGI